MNPAGQTGQLRIRGMEADWGCPLRDVLHAFARAGWYRKHTAAALGLSKQTVDRYSALHNVQWPARRHRPATIERLRHVRRRRTRAVIWVDLEGEQVPLAEAGHRLGITPNALYERYRHGKRGADLLAPQTKTWRRPACYHLGIAERDLHWIYEMTHELGIRTTAGRLHLPYGAVSAIARGEWERLG